MGSPDLVDLFAQLSEQVNNDWNELSAWRKAAREDFKFAHANQWSDEELAVLDDAEREAMMFDRIGPTLRRIVGEEIKNRREVRFKPRTADDGGLNEALNAAVEFFRDDQGAEAKESASLMDALICGVGWTQDRVDFDEDPNGRVVIDWLDPFEVGYNHEAHQPNLTDATRLWRVKRMSLAEAREMFPQYSDDNLNATWFLGKDLDLPEGEDHASLDPHRRRQRAAAPGVGDKVTMVEVQYYKRERYAWVLNPNTGTYSEVPDDVFSAILEKLDETPPFQIFYKRVYYTAILGGALLDHALSMNQVGFTFKAITCYRDRQQGVFYGLLRTLKAPQRWYNRLMTLGLHTLSSAAKGGVIYDKKLTDDPDEFEDRFAATDSAIAVDQLYGPSGQSNIMPKPQTPIPPEIAMLARAADAAFDQATGMNAESRGEVDKVQSPLLASQRRQSAMTVLQPVFDALRSYRMHQGKSFLYYIQHYVGDGRLIRIVGDKKGRYVPLIRSPDSIEYDVVIDDSPTSPNEKERQWPIIEAGLKMFGNMLPPSAVVKLMKYSPLSTDLAEEIIQDVEAAKPPPELQKMQQEMKMQDIRLSFAMKEAQIERARADAARSQAQAAAAAAMIEPEMIERLVRAEKLAAEAHDLSVQSQPEAQNEIAQAKLHEAQARAEQARVGVMRAQQQMGFDGARGELELMDRTQRAAAVPSPASPPAVQPSPPSLPPSPPITNVNVHMDALAPVLGQFGAAIDALANRREPARRVVRDDQNRIIGVEEGSP